MLWVIGHRGTFATPISPLTVVVGKLQSRQITIMKTFRFIIVVTVLVGVLGCSTSTSKNAIGHHSDFAAAAMMEDAKRLFEVGEIDAAEQKLLSVLAIEPNNRRAHYYLTLVEERQAEREASQRRQKPWGYYPTYPPRPIYQ